MKTSAASLISLLVALSAFVEISHAAEKAKINLAELFGGITNAIGKLNELEGGKGKDTLKAYCEENPDAASGSRVSVRDSCRERPLNLAFLVEGSNFVSKDSFEKVLDLVKNVVDSFDIGPDSTRVALAQYSDLPRAEIKFKDHDDAEDLKDAIGRLERRGGGSSVSAGLGGLSKLFSSSRGWRKAADTVLIVITYKKDAANVKIASSKLRRRVKGLKIITLGIEPGEGEADGSEFLNTAGDLLSTLFGKGKGGLKLPRATVGDLDVEYLGDVASRKEGIFVACGFDSLNDGLAQSIVQGVCDEIDDTCRTSYSDIVFMVETSDIRTNGDAIKNFLKSMVDKQDIGSGKTRIALVQYYQNAQPVFGYSDSKSAIRRGIDGMRPANTGSQRYLMHSIYETSEKHRLLPTASQQLRGNKDAILVILTTGPSVDYAPAWADAVTGRGVTVVGIGIGTDGQATKRIVATGDGAGHVFSVPDHTGLNLEARDRLTRMICDQKPSIKMLEGLQQIPGCRDGHSSAALFGAGYISPPDYSVNSPRRCLQRCKQAGRPTEVIGVQGYWQCFCGTEKVAKAAKRAGHPSWCASPCIYARYNPHKVNCGGGVGLVLFKNKMS